MNFMKSLAGSALLSTLAMGSAFGFGGMEQAEQGPAQQAQQGSVVEVLSQLGEFKTLASALEATDLLATLNSEGPYTVFAPTDAAFSELGQDTLESLLAQPDELSSILLYHVVPGQVGVIGAVLKGQAQTVNGAQLKFSLRGFTPYVNESKIIRANIRADNGIIHVIDQVLVPPQEQPQQPESSIVDLVMQDDRFSTLRDLLEAADLVDTLRSEGPFTVFAPTNEAFNQVPQKTLDALMMDQEQLRKVLLYHVLQGQRIPASEAVSLESLATANDQSISLQVSGDTLMVNDAKVIETDIAASNGVVHVIDRVLIP